MKTKPTDLATVAPAGQLAPLNYAIASVDPSTILEMLQENTGESTISEFDLDRIKVPSGGNTTWAVPSLEGEEELKAIEGVVVYQRTVRSFWEKRMEESGGGSPPDCSSPDGQFGVGTPKLGDIVHPDYSPDGPKYGPDGSPVSYICKHCPLAAFGSGGNGRSQACKQSRLVFVIREDNVLPMLIAAPPSSLRGMKQYMLRLSGSGVPFYGVVTSFSLKKEKNADNIIYSEIVPAMVRRLDPTDTAKMRAMSQALGPLLDAVTAEPITEPEASGQPMSDEIAAADAEREAFLGRMRAEA